VRDDCEARVARDAAFGGSKGLEKHGAVGNGGTGKLGIATTRAVFDTSEGSGVRDWWWERPGGARPKGEMAAQEPCVKTAAGEDR
jgi:hypothetical protein